MKKIKIPELLSPAGSFLSLRAAVENGCDAVYLGGKQFSARNRADNFDDEELESAIDYCHARGVKLFLAVNTLYKNQELNKLFNFIDKMYRLGADAFILQDIGAASLISSNFPELPLHASTQMSVADRAGAEFLAESGFSRLTLARELSLPEIKTISGSNIETEVFVHGALCVCYSGQCRLSGMLGGRGGNRGNCAQPCRLAYELYKDSTPVHSGYLLSPRDIMTLKLLPEIIGAGVASLKIEGRMKSPEYVALTTRMYREGLDAIRDGRMVEWENGEFSLTDLTQIFNRGGSFSPGYFKNFAGIDMMSPKTSKSTGVQIGVVTSYDRVTGKCVISITQDLLPGDGIEIWTRSEPHAGTNINKNYLAGSNAVINIKGIIHPRDPVYRSFDKRLSDELKRLCASDTRKIQVRFSVKAKIGESIELSLISGNTAVTVTGETVCLAQNRPITREQLLQRIMKTGNTTLEFVPDDIYVEENIFLGIGGINELRREASELFMKEYLKSFRREPHKSLPEIATAHDPEALKPLQKLFVLVRTPEQFDGALSEYVDRIYFELSDFFLYNIPEYMEQAKLNGIEIFACLPYVSREADVKSLRENISFLSKSGVDGFLARTYGQMHILREMGASFVADHTLNVFNALSKETLFDNCGVTFSTELSIEEIEAAQPDGNCEIVIHGRNILMMTHQCPVGLYSCGKKSGKFCGLRNQSEGYALKDRKGMMFPVRTDCENCVAYILNGKLTFTLNKISSIKKSYVGGVRLMFDDEGRDETAEVVYAYGHMIKDLGEPDERIRNLTDRYVEAGVTYGHFYRGVQ